VKRRILVAGVGNIFLGDDGFGSEVARRLSRRPLPDGVRVVDYGIRGMHLTYDLLDGYDALVIVDALPGSKQPGELTVLEVGADDLGEGEFDAHGMDPVAVLASLGALGGKLPRTFIVGCQPFGVGDGIGLSPAVSGSVDAAAALVTRLVNELLADQASAGVSPGRGE
jgi:hydrogenase maturation protease